MLTLKTMGKMVSKLVMTFMTFMTLFYDFVYASETKLLSRTRPRNVKKKSVFCDICSPDSNRLSWWIRLLRMVRYTFHSGLRWLRSRMDCTFTSSRIFKSKISVKSCFDHLYFSSLKHGSPVCGCWFSKLGTKLEKEFIKHNIHTTTTTTLKMSHHLACFLWTRVWAFSSQITWAWNANQGMILILNSELYVNLLQCLEYPLLLKRTILCFPSIRSSSND